MKETKKNTKILLPILLVALLILMVGGVTYAFFNYTGTGVANTLQVGRIAFNSTQNNTIRLENVFPTSSNSLNSSNSDTVTITITGDTTYSEGIEYKVTLEDVHNTINNKEVPISFSVDVTDLGDHETDYYTERGGEDAIYNFTESGEAEDGKYILVGYIPSGATGVDGSIDITAYIDGDRVAISDTVSTIENGNLVYGETRGDWIAGREVLTTSEWNSLTGNNGISFKVRVEANEGLWLEEETFYVMKKPSGQAWANIRANITSIEFHKDGIAPSSPVATIDVTDVTSKGTVTVYTVDDELGTNTYKAIVVADDVIYAPEDCTRLFSNMTKLVTFNSENFKVDNVTNMSWLFAKCSQLQNVDGLVNWNTLNVTNMAYMFNGCSQLQNVNGLINWNMSNVTNIGRMFFECTNLSDVDGLKNWNTSNVTNMAYMFNGCSQLQNVNGLINWNTSNVTYMTGMFVECTSLTNIDGLIDWNTGNVTDMSFMFAMDDGKTKTGNPVIDFSCLTNWNVSKVENMSVMFQNVNVASYLPFRNWNVGRVQNFSGMFNATPASTVTTLSGLENWNVGSATNMESMFQDNVSLTDASAINDWNIKSSIDFNEMFHSTPVHPEFTKVSGTWDSEGTFTPNA